MEGEEGSWELGMQQDCLKLKGSWTKGPGTGLFLVD